jgi:hypothetical protein
MKTLFAFFVLSFGLIPLPVVAQPSSDSANPVARLEARVTKHLQSYFLTHDIEGSVRPEYVTVDIDSTTPIQGWDKRYITIGTATITPESEHAKSYTCHFEVTAEIDGNDIVQIIDIQSKRIHS